MTNQNTEFEAIKRWYTANEKRFEEWLHDSGDGEVAFDLLERAITLVESERARADKAEAELARVREAAGPFVKEALDPEWSDFSDNKQIKYATNLKLRDLRRLARAVGEEG